jgi:hypothetical protein
MLILIIMIVILLVSIAIAGSNSGKFLKTEYVRPVSIIVSSNGINRINFSKIRIAKIVGDASRYEVVLSEDGSNLFLTSKVAAGEGINLSLITAKGELIDLRVQVMEGTEPSLINLSLTEDRDVDLLEQQEIAELINHMADGDKGKYYVQKVSRRLRLKDKPNLIVRQETLYGYGDLMGAAFTVFSVSNRGKHEETISKEDILGLFEGVLAVAISDQGIAAGEKASVFVVFKKTD